MNGVPGTVTFNLNGSNDSALTVHATATIVEATGGLAGLHGVLHEVGTVVIPSGPVGTYTGKSTERPHLVEAHAGLHLSAAGAATPPGSGSIAMTIARGVGGTELTDAGVGRTRAPQVRLFGVG